MYFIEYSQADDGSYKIRRFIVCLFRQVLHGCVQSPLTFYSNTLFDFFPLLFKSYSNKNMDPSIHEVPESSESQEDDVVVLQEFPTHHTERSASRGSYKDTKSNHSNECHPKDDGDDENDIMFIENVKSHSKSNPSSMENVESSSEQNGNLSVTKDQEDDTEEGELSVNDGELGAGVCDFIVIDEVGADVDVDENGECSNEDEPSVVFSEDPTGLFCLDTNPEVSKEKPLGPRFRRVGFKQNKFCI